MKTAPILLALGLVCACSKTSTAPPPGTGPMSPTSITQKAQPTDWSWTQSNGGGFWCAWRALEGPVSMGPSFAMEIKLAKGEGGEALELPEGALTVDARMPDHGHGMLQRVEIERLAPGHYRVVGMRLHMLGYWELLVDVERPPITERAQFAIQL